MTTEVLPNVDTKKTLMPMYRVIIHNDDVNTMEHVIEVLQEVFKFEFEQCLAIMLEAHKTGCALCKVEPLEPAELHCEMLQACSLTATIEPE